jgi:TonB family protein
MPSTHVFRLRFVLALVALLSAGPGSNPAASAAGRSLQDHGTLSQTGIEFYENGNFPEALKIFKTVVKNNKNDVLGWHYLGLTFDRLGKLSDARKAHEKAAKNGVALLVSEMTNAKMRDSFDSLRAIDSQLHYAASSARRYLDLSGSDSRSKQSEANERADLLSDFAKLSSPQSIIESLGKVVSSADVTTKLRILAKPEPQYTEEARQHQTTGAVVLRAILGRDGKVHAILPVNPLPYGLTRRAIMAARQIRFEPAIKDGQPVSVLVQLEYHFNLY